VQIHLREKET